MRVKRSERSAKQMGSEPGFRTMWEITEAARGAEEKGAKPCPSPRAECPSPVRPYGRGLSTILVPGCVDDAVFRPFRGVSKLTTT